jgi:hypothetical protein
MKEQPRPRADDPLRGLQSEETGGTKISAAKNLITAAFVGAVVSTLVYIIVLSIANGFGNTIDNFSHLAVFFIAFDCLAVSVPGFIFGMIAGAIGRRIWPKRRWALIGLPALGGVIWLSICFLLQIAVMSTGIPLP